MGEKNYTYAVSRIRAIELSMLDKADYEQLLAARDIQECTRILADKGFESPEKEREKMWALIRELVEDLSPFAMFLIPYDYHNLKASVKMVCTDDIREDCLISYGLTDPQKILNAVKEQDFSALPDGMADVGKAAFEALLHTHNGQQCDVLIDQATLAAVYELGKHSPHAFLREYAELNVACTDIRIAVRGLRTGKSLDWIRAAMTPCDSLDLDSLAKAAAGGMQELIEYLAVTPYSGGAPALEESLSEFEKWCDRQWQDRTRLEAHNAFTIAPIAAYILTRENEIRTVRLILAGKRNEMPEQAIRDRLCLVG